MGSWYRGNDPASQTGNPSLESRVYCEAMYQINECEDFVGQTKTSWADIGTFPAVDALKAYAGAGSATYTGKTLITQMRAAVESLLSSGEGTPSRVYAKSATDHTPYTKATLLTAAFGATDWSTLDNQAIADGTAISEILKAVELLTHPIVSFDEDDAWLGKKAASRYWWSNWWSSISEALSDCDAATPSWTSVNSLGSASSIGGHWYLFDATNETEYYEKYVTYCRVPQPQASYSPTLNAVKLYCQTDQAHQDSASTVYVYSVSSSQYSTHSWSAVGTLMHTYSLPSSSSTLIEWVDTPSAISPTASNLYLEFWPQTATPFPNDLETIHLNHVTAYHVSDAYVYSPDFMLEIYYTFTHTYG